MYTFYELNFIDTVEALHIMQDILDMWTSSSLYMKDLYTHTPKEKYWPIWQFMK